MGPQHRDPSNEHCALDLAGSENQSTSVDVPQCVNGSVLKPYGTRIVTLEKVLEVAREIGLEGLTIKEVSRRLRVTPAAIYKRVRSKEKLEALVVAQEFADLTLPEDPGNVREYLFRLCRCYLEFCLEHPGFVEASMLHADSRERSLSYQKVLDTLMRYGYSIGVADDLATSVENIAHGLYVYIRRMYSAVGRTDFVYQVGGYRITIDQMLAIMMSPCIDGLLACSDPAFEEIRIFEELHRGLPEGFVPPLQQDDSTPEVAPGE